MYYQIPGPVWLLSYRLGSDLYLDSIWHTKPTVEQLETRGVVNSDLLHAKGYYWHDSKNWLLEEYKCPPTTKSS